MNTCFSVRYSLLSRCPRAIAIRLLVLALLAGVLLGASCSGSSPGDVSEEDVLACALLEELVARSTEPTASSLFRRADGQCAAVAPEELDRLATTMLFTDDSCSQSVSFRGTSFLEFCADHLLGTDRTRDNVGNPEAWRDAERDDTGIRTPWTLARDATLRVGALDQTELPRPFVQRLEYRRAGECSLGMHVYVPSLGARDLRPALLIHGGGWRHRGAAAVAGIGVVAPQLTSRGYAVFAPFHRLTGDSDGPAACRGATGREIVDDIEAALDWVLEHGGDFGVDPAVRELAVVGQSSGGHLGAWLYVHRSQDVRRALLLYPLTDVPFLVRQLGDGGIFAGNFERGESLLLGFMAEPGVTVAADLSPDSEFAQLNSFVAQVDQQPDAFGALDLVHGAADTNVPVELTVRLCQARDPAQTPSDGPWPGGDADFDCGDGSSATIVADADHVLDLRCVSGDKARILSLVDDDLGALCTAGSPAQEERVRQALLRAYARF